MKSSALAAYWYFGHTPQCWDTCPVSLLPTQAIFPYFACGLDMRLLHSYLHLPYCIQPSIHAHAGTYKIFFTRWLFVLVKCFNCVTYFPPPQSLCERHKYTGTAPFFLQSRQFPSSCCSCCGPGGRAKLRWLAASHTAHLGILTYTHIEIYSLS